MSAPPSPHEILADVVRKTFLELSEKHRSTIIKKATPHAPKSTKRAILQAAHAPATFQINRIDRWLTADHQQRIENALLTTENERFLRELLLAFFCDAHKGPNELLLSLIDPDSSAPRTFEEALSYVAGQFPNDPFQDLFAAAVRWICHEKIRAQKETLALQSLPGAVVDVVPNLPNWLPLDTELELLDNALRELRSARVCDLPGASAALERANAAARQLAEKLSRLATSAGEAAPTWSTRDEYVSLWQRLAELARSKEKQKQKTVETVAEIIRLLSCVSVHHRLPRKQEQLALLTRRAADEIAQKHDAFISLLSLPAEPALSVPAALADSPGRTWLYCAWHQEGAAAEKLHEQLQPIAPALAELLAAINWSDLAWVEVSAESRAALSSSRSESPKTAQETLASPVIISPIPIAKPEFKSTNPCKEEVPPPRLEAAEQRSVEITPPLATSSIQPTFSTSETPAVAESTSSARSDSKPIGPLAASEARPLPSQSLTVESRDIADHVWRLATEKRFGLASRLASTDTSGAVPPAWIFEAALLGPRVIYELSPISERLTELFLNSADLRLDRLPSSEQLATRLLLAGAALRPALLAPQSNAASVLKLTELKEELKLTAFDAVVDAVAEFGLHREPLQPAMLRLEHDRADWEQQLARVRLEIRDWAEKAPHRTFNFGAATRIWRDWTASEGKLRRLLDQTAVATHQSLAALESAWEPWRTKPDDLVQSAMKDIKQRMTMVGSARDTLITRIGEAVDLANRLFALVSQAPRNRENYREGQVRALLDSIQEHGPAAARELERLNSDSDSVSLRAAAALCQLGLKQLHDLLHGQIPIPGGEEANPKWLVDAELLRDPEIPLTSEGISQTAKLDAGKLVALAKSTPDWLQAWDLQTNAENHVATAGLLDFFRWQPQSGIDVSHLEQRRERDLETCRRSVERRADSVSLSLDEFVKLGLCREKDYLDWNAEVEAVKKEALAEGTLQFAPLRSRLDKVRQDIDRERERAATKVRERLEATPQIDSIGRDRILALLETGDVHTATDYLDRAAQGKPLPDHTNRSHVFREFFGENGWLTKAEGAIRQSSMHDCWQAVRDGIDWHGLNFKALGPEQRADAANHIQLWLNIERERRAQDHQISNLAAALGLQPLKARGEVPRPGRNVVQRCDLQAERLDEREASVVAPFGSDANGKYTLHLVWGEPGAEELINLCKRETGDTRGHIIICFRYIFPKERRELAEVARKRFLKAIVVDRAMFAFLCAQTGARFATLLRIALPFTRVEPYTISAGAVPPEIFFGRRRELESLADPRGSCFVYGGRQLGKTALLRALERRFHQPERGRAAVFVDLKSELFSRGRPVDDLWALLVSKLKEANVLGDNVGASAGQEALFRHIREWLDKESDRRLLLLLDESDSFLEQDGKETNQHEPFPRCQRLKNLMEITGRRFKVVFAGLHNVQRTTRVSNHPLAHFGETICVGPMLEEAESREARALVEEPLAAVGYFFDSPDAVSRVLALTNYYPSLVQLFCYHMLADLRENHVTRFSNTRSTPPFIISSAHVQAAYGSRVRQAIHDKVNLTLHLDSRYELIAYLLAFYHASEPGHEGLELRAIRDEAVYYWPKGFEEMRTDDEFRSLLEEMVGLGILRQVSGTSRFALRNPNVMMLLGTDEEIARRLEKAKEWEPALRYEADKFRRIIAEHPRPVFSPLTAQSEGELRASEHRVAVVYGLPAAGLGELPAAMESDSLFGKARTVLIRGCTQPTVFSQRLAALKREPPHTLALVPSEEPWDESWVIAALRRVEQFTSKDAFLTVLFVADPQRATKVVPALNEVRESAIRDFSLRPWHDAAVRQWLQDLNLGDDRTIRQRIYAVTGNWPVLLARLNTDSMSELQRSCDNLESRLRDPSELSSLKAAFGLADEPNDSPLRTAAEARRFTTDWICQFLEINDPTIIRNVSNRLKTAEKLGVISASGSEWEFDPVASRILLSV